MTLQWIPWVLILTNGHRVEDVEEVNFLQAPFNQLIPHANRTNSSSSLSVTLLASEILQVVHVPGEDREKQLAKLKKVLEPRTLKDVSSTAGIALAAAVLNLVDIIWMLPFLVTSAGFFNAFLFAAISQLWVNIVVVAHAYGGIALRKYNKDVDFTIGFLGLLVALVQYMQQDPQENETGEHGKEERNFERFSSGAFVALSALGTFDQILIYAPLLEDNLVTSIDIEIAILLASMVTLTMCFMASRIQPFLSMFEVIPAWLPALFVGSAALLEGLLEM